MQRANEARALAAKDDEPRAADLGAALEIDQAEPAPISQCGCTARLRAASPQLRTTELFSSPPAGTSIERDVGQLEKNRDELALGLSQLAIESRDLVAQCARLLLEIVGRLSRALALAHLLA